MGRTGKEGRKEGEAGGRRGWAALQPAPCPPSTCSLSPQVRTRSRSRHASPLPRLLKPHKSELEVGLGEVPDRFMLGRGMAGKRGGGEWEEGPHTHTQNSGIANSRGECAGWVGGAMTGGLGLSPPASRVPSHPTCSSGEDGL